MNKFNVLVAEDHPLNLQLAERILTKKGANVISAENGLEALNLFKKSEENYFDIVFMDVNMPELNGFESIHEIRKLDRTDSKSVPIYIMSGDILAIEKINDSNLHISGTINKPLDKEIIQLILEKHINN